MIKISYGMDSDRDFGTLNHQSVDLGSVAVSDCNPWWESHSTEGGLAGK
jgi:hypothetical protein